ncbi:ferrous iron transporter B [Halopseudomonas nanhaiensis]|uniref:ferrous iron transporter B n=1 Tax=Halopseudomonas nanhaiensis TaxID=2830842 RepID=UPI001CC0E866|nr:ferrous iron transporter B [Halopseudomonas nanhaiensis]UAW97021.1 ferrous iron transporter B [Halopseudomonas nanhaiensis]
MLTGATSLDLVRDELFASIGEVEDLLQQFLDDRHNGSLLQRAIEGLQQLRGTFDLIEMTGAALLLSEMVALATDVPEHDGTERNAPLSSLCDSLFLLERYIEQCRLAGFEQPELLIPTINELRKHRADAEPLAQSHFYRLDASTLPAAVRAVGEGGLEKHVFNRLRQMYQLGLLGLIRDDGIGASTPLMLRALQRWENNLPPQAATLCWVAGAAIESIEDTPLHLTMQRKRLFAQVDREVKKYAGQTPGAVEPARGLLRELLFLVALAGPHCQRCNEVKSAFELPDPGYTEQELLQAFDRLRGPGVDVMRSVAEALREEVTAIKDLLDLLARNAGDPDQALETLDAALQRLWKTLGMLDLHEVADVVRRCVGRLERWQPGDQGVLEDVADAVLQAEMAVNRLDGQGDSRGRGSDAGNPGEPVELKEARIVLIEESQAGLALAKRSVTAYMESGSDTMHLMNVPSSLETVRGGLIFLGMTRAASIIHLAARFIQESMLERKEEPQPQQLEVLADALTGIEFYLESAERSSVATADVLTLAEDSLAELGYSINEAG